MSDLVAFSKISPTHILDRHSVPGLPLDETYLRTRSGVLTGVTVGLVECRRETNFLHRMERSRAYD